MRWTFWPCGPVWCVTSCHAQHALGFGCNAVHGFDDFDAAAFAAAAGMNLRFDDPDRFLEIEREGLGDIDGFVGRKGNAAARHRNAVFFQKAFGLVFMDVHESKARLFEMVIEHRGMIEGLA